MIGNIYRINMKRERLLFVQRPKMLLGVGSGKVFCDLALCEDPARRDGIDADAFFAKFPCQPGGQPQNACFGSGVYRTADNAQTVVDGRDIDNRPSPSPTQQWEATPNQKIVGAQVQVDN